MSIAVIARFSAAYASFAKLVLVSSRGTSRLGAERALISGIPQVYGIPEGDATRFARRLIRRFRKCEERVGAGFSRPRASLLGGGQVGGELQRQAGMAGQPFALLPHRESLFLHRRQHPGD